MKHILFITNRNVLTTCGELRLIKNRAEALWNIYGYTTDFIALSAPARITSTKREAISSGGVMHTISLPRNNPLGILRACQELIRTVRAEVEKKEYDVVIISGLLMPAFGKIIKNICKLPIVYDFHGALEDTYESAAKSGLAKRVVFRMFYFLENALMNSAFKHADGCLVVTKALKSYLQNRYPKARNLDYYIVPCSIADRCMSEEEYRNNRKEYRQKYGLNENISVFLYSGGTSAWQCIDETIELFKQLRATINKPIKCLMYSHNISVIRDKVGDDPDFITDSYAPDELGKALCAADFAFLLRKKCPTNQVAFPNKYMEYVRANLSIIATPNVEEIAKQVSNNKLGVIYNMDGNICTILDGLSNMSKKYNAETIQMVISNNSFGYCLSQFAERFDGKKN